MSVTATAGIWLSCVLHATAPAAATEALASGGQGERPSSQRIEQSYVVVGLPEGDPSFDTATFRDALAIHFEGTGLATEVVEVPRGTLPEHLLWASTRTDEPDVRVVFWVEGAPAGGHRLYLMQPNSGGGLGRVWVREVPQASDPDLMLESLGVMLRALATGLDESTEPSGMEPVVVELAASQANPPPEPEPEPSRSAHRVSLRVAAEYVGGNLDGRSPFASGVGARLGLDDATGALVYVGAAWMAPSSRADGAVVIQRVPVVFGGGYRFRRDADLTPTLDVGLTTEPIWWTIDDRPGVRGRNGHSWRVAVSPGGGFDWRLWRGLGVHAHVRIDVWVSDLELVIEREGRRENVFDPHPVSATLRLGLHYAF